jgi:transcription initiation factor IIE alpha subunit
MSTDTVTYPYPFVKGFMGFDTEQDLMRDFTASMREAGIKRYATSYRELCETANRPLAQPTTFVPTVVKPSEGGDMPTGGNGNGATYEGPKDLDYNGKKFGKVPGTRSGNGYVHGMTPKQISYVLFLLKTKDTRELSTKLLRGWTLDPNQIHTISKRHAIPFIDALKACNDKGANVSVKKELTGSPRQIEWITKGLNGKASLLKEKGYIEETDIKTLYAQHNYSAKSIIDALLKMDTVRTQHNTTTVEITEGMYTLGERIFKVYMNRANTCMLVKELIDGEFEYLGSAQWKLPKGAVRMTLDEAKAYGRLTGTCCQCGAKLTDETSIAEGIGPICAGKF